VTQIVVWLQHVGLGRFDEGVDGGRAAAAEAAEETGGGATGDGDRQAEELRRRQARDHAGRRTSPPEPKPSKPGPKSPALAWLRDPGMPSSTHFDALCANRPKQLTVPQRAQPPQG